jgi:hypothetical protein
MKHLITLICDDIRSEIGNKISIVGIFDEAILPHNIPARLPKLCLYQLWEADHDIFSEAERMRIELRGSALASIYSVEAIARKQPHGVAPDEPSRGPGGSAKRGRLMLTFSPVEIVSEGDLEFVTYVKDSHEPEHVHKLSVRRGPPKTD